MAVRVSRGLGVLGSILRVVGLIIVIILVVHILLFVLGANSGNAFASFISREADFFSLGLGNLFVLTDSPNLQVILNYGLAAIIWFVLTALVVGGVRRIG